MTISTMSGCSVKSSRNEVIHLKMAVADADSSAQAEGARRIASEVEKATDGKVQIEVMAGGTLGAERDTVELAMLGGIDIVTSANSVLTQWIPEMSILDQAYLLLMSSRRTRQLMVRLENLLKEKHLINSIYM